MRVHTRPGLSGGPDADLNSAAKGISEGVGMFNAIRELVGEVRQAMLNADASALKGMLLSIGTGNVEEKKLRTKQLWVQGTIQSYSVEMHKCLAPRTLQTV